MDRLDVALLQALRDHPRAGALELSRLTGVARATVQSRIEKLEGAGVLTGYGPDIDLDAAGFTVQAFVTLEITQGALDEVRDELKRHPAIVEAYATTGTSDVVCRMAARSKGDLQEALLEVNRSPHVARSTSVVILSTVVAPRVLPLLGEHARAGGRAPAFREARQR
ncbi:Lrp/AsnC family transcriptional regulator [Nonomuraea harbinensis]|uniref:Lrp/AsnC family transcriptional regulator n=1 Tax=Nonomuraea harbinensis TaxID=1286938 RepID=A0ABW1BLF7_9ACTN|nr:Lrp/AsnC family transcriptional regulator [Nonomuraea harbinensis]